MNKKPHPLCNYWPSSLQLGREEYHIIRQKLNGDFLITTCCTKQLSPLFLLVNDLAFSIRVFEWGPISFSNLISLWQVPFCLNVLSFNLNHWEKNHLFFLGFRRLLLEVTKLVIHLCLTCTKSSRERLLREYIKVYFFPLHRCFCIIVTSDTLFKNKSFKLYFCAGLYCLPPPPFSNLFPIFQKPPLAFVLLLRLTVWWSRQI